MSGLRPHHAATEGAQAPRKGTVVGLLDQLMGGGERRQDYQDFTDRYEQGQPHEGYDDQEVASRYQEVAGEVDPETYRSSAHQAFEKMSPDDRTEYARQLNEQAGSQGIDTGVAPGGGVPGNDPATLADMTTRVHQQSPGLLGGLLGGGGSGTQGEGGLGALLGGGGGLGGMLGGGGDLGGMLGGAGGLGGMLGGGGGGAGGGGLGGMLGGAGGGNPLMRAAMAGITAFAAKQMMNRQ